MIWAEIRNDYSDEGKVFIDAWLTNTGEEEGKVIAKVYKNEKGEVVVDYLDERAKEDSYAQEVIQESIQKLKGEEINEQIK